MFQLYFTLLLAVSSHISGSAMKSDPVDLATVLNHVNQLEAGLRNTMTTLQTTGDDLAATKTVLQRTRDDLGATKTELQSTKADLVATMTELHATKKDLAWKTNNVAFNVFLTHIIQTGSSLPVKFDCSDGNAYNSTTGKFTAPVSGTYIFSTGVIIEANHRATYIRIMQSGSIVSAGYGNATKDFSYINVPVTAITPVKEGEQVWVDSTSDVTLIADGGFHVSHFVGALMSPD